MTTLHTHNLRRNARREKTAHPGDWRYVGPKAVKHSIDAAFTRIAESLGLTLDDLRNSKPGDGRQRVAASVDRGGA